MKGFFFLLVFIGHCSLADVEEKGKVKHKIFGKVTRAATRYNER